jgi:glycosyltransferase involved in cell wall biosynthesis
MRSGQNRCQLPAISFIFLSYYEGFGLPVLEAMQTGLPVICSNSSSLPEVVGDAGILVDPDDIPMIVSKLSKLLKNKKLRETYKAKSIIQAKKFNWETTTYLTKIAYKADL